jgi:Mrp family chromosome partitioning ATPase
LRTAGLLPPEDKARIRRNEFRSIKSPLVAAAALHSTKHPEQRASVAAVVSSLPGEGKTYVSLNLASSLAFERDVTTVIIDGDVARHKLSTLLGVHDLPGFTDYLADEKLTLADVLLPTSESSVFVMPAGKWREYTAELIASARVQTLLRGISQLAERPLVILDCPPLLVTSEAAALMAIADQALFVVRAGYSQQGTVEEAAAKLDRSKPIHVVLNAWQPLSIAERAYYSKYRDYYDTPERM